MTKFSPSPELVEKYKAYLEKIHPEATQKRKISSLRRFFSWLKSAGKIDENPLDKQQALGTREWALDKNNSGWRETGSPMEGAPELLPGGMAMGLSSDRTRAQAAGPAKFIKATLLASGAATTLVLAFLITKSPSTAFLALKSLAQAPLETAKEAGRLVGLSGGAQGVEVTPSPSSNPSSPGTSDQLPGNQSAGAEGSEASETANRELAPDKLKPEILLQTSPLSDGDITLAPDGQGQVLVRSGTTSQNSFDIRNANLTTGALIYGNVGNNSTNYDFIRFTNGINETLHFSVNAVGNTFIGGKLDVRGPADIDGELFAKRNITSGANVNAQGLLTNGVTRINGSGALDNITGYNQTSGNFTITQSASDSAKITKTASAKSDLLTLSLTEKFPNPNSKYDTLVLERINGGNDAYALYVKEGQAKFDGAVNIRDSLTVQGSTISTGGDLSTTGNLTVNGNSTLGDSSSDTITANGRFNSSLIPSADNTYDIGSSSLRWRNIYIGTDATIDGDIAVNGGDLTTTATTFNLINSTATTVNFAGAGTTVSIGATSGTTTINNALAVTGDTTLTGDLAVNGGDITTTSATFNFVNAATTLNIGSTAVTRAINLGTGTLADTISIGTGGTTADTINIGTGAVANSITIGTTTASSSLALNDDNWNITGAGAANFVSIGAVTRGTGNFTTLDANGNTTLGDASSDTLTVTAAVASNITPDANNTRNLGSSSLRWNTIYGVNGDFTNIAGTLSGGSTTAASWTINSDNATADAEISSLAFETGTGNFNAVEQWNAAGDAGRFAGYDSNFVFNFPISIISQVSGANTTFTGGSLFNYGQALAHAITQASAFVGLDTDFSSNITVPNSSSGNQTGALVTLKDGGASATAIGFQTAGTFDYGLDIGGTPGTAEIRLSNGETIANTTDGTIALTATTLSMASTTTLNCGDCIDFDDIADSPTLDAATDINLSTFALTIDMDSTGDFSIRDGTTDILAFTDSGAITATPTSGQNFAVTVASTGAFNITSATGSQTFTSSVTTGSTTTSGFVFDATAINSGTGLYLTTDSVTTGRLLDIATTGNTWTGNSTTNGLINIASTSTAGTASASNILLNLARSGANSNTAVTTYGLYSTVTNTNATSGTNVAAYLSASGATTANYGLIVNAGNVGIGVTNPGTLLDVAGAAQIRGTSNGSVVLTLGTAGTINAVLNTGDEMYINIDSDNNSSGQSFHFGVNRTYNSGGTELMTIVGDSGNVGIGDTAPDALLDVNGTGISSGPVVQIGSPESAITVAGSATALTLANLDLATNYTTADDDTTGLSITLDTASDTDATQDDLLGITISGGTLSASGGSSNPVWTGAKITTPATTNTNTSSTGITLRGFDATTTALTQTQAETITINAHDISSAGALVQNTNAGTINWRGNNIVLPIITQTTGTVSASGVRVLVPASGAIVTGGTMNGIDVVAPTTSGPAAGTLNGVFIENLTSAGAGTETAVNIGSGWDQDINATTSLEVAIGGTNQLTLTDGALAGTTDNDIDLGTSSSQFKDLYIQGDILVDTATDIDIDDNTASAFTISEGANNYFLITTADDVTVLTLDLPVAGSTSTTGNLFTANTTKTINLGTGTAADTINIGTGGTNADAITLGNTGVATTFDINSGAATVNAIDIATDSVSSANALALTANALTSGTALALSSTATAFNGELLTLSKTGASGSTSFTSDIANITYSQTFNATGTSNTGNVLDISRAITIDDSTAGAISGTVSGAAATISDNCTAGTADTCTSTGNILSLTQNYSSATGAILKISNAGSGADIALDNDETITNTTDGTITFGVSGAGELSITATATSPSTDSGQDLGTSSSQFADLYLDGGNINLDNATDIDIDDNTASALTVSAGSDTYFLITTSTGAEVVTLNNIEAGTMNIGTANVTRTLNLATGTGADTINIGTGGTTADTITIGNNASSTSLALTSGTGSQTFTSSVATGTTTTSAFVFTDASLTSGTGIYDTSSSVTTGRLLDIATTGNTWTGNSTTSGLVNLASTSTAGTASDSDILLNIARSGANSNTAHTAYGIYSTVTNTNATSGTNIAAYLSASGATTANYGLIVNAGNVGIGDTSPDATLETLVNFYVSEDAAGDGDVLSVTNTGTVFSEDGTDRDFRIESDGNANMFTLDAGSNVIAIGAGVNAASEFMISGTHANTGDLEALRINTTFTVPAGNSAYGINVTPTFTEAGSVNHTLLASVNIAAATVTGGVATVSNTASLYIANAMTATVSGANYALWVDAGTTRLDGAVSLAGATTIDPTTTGTFLDFELATEWTAGDLVNFDWASAVTQTAATTIIDIDFTNFTSVAGSTTYGLHINDLSAQTTSTEYGIYVEGTNYDYGIVSNDVVLIGTPDSNEVLLGMNANTAGHEGISLFHDGTEAWITSVDSGNVWQSLTLQSIDVRFDINGTTDDIVLGASSFVFNENGDDTDFRIESDNNANAFVLDAGAFGGTGVSAFGGAVRTDASMSILGNTLTATSNSNYFRTLWVNGSAVTVAGATTSDIVGTVNIDEPNITATGTVNTAVTFRISGAPTEGTNNYALWVDAGQSAFPAGTALLPSIIPEADPNTGMWFPAADTVAVSTAGSERIRIDSAGNVGIGITSPTGKLQVKQSTDVNLMVNTVTAGAITLNAINDANTVNVPLELRGSNVIVTAGNVGIGTTNPAANLELGASDALIQLKTFGRILAGPGTANDLTVGAGRDLYFDIERGAAATGTQAFIFRYNNTGSEIIRFQEGGNVGIGTTAPSSAGKLTIHEATDKNLRSAGNQNLSDGVYLDSVNDAYNTQKGFEIKGSTVRLTDNTGYMVLTGGNVGIGTTAPVGKLEVLTTANGNSLFYVSISNGESVSGSFNAIRSTRAGSTAYSFLDMLSDYDGTPDNEYLFQGNGAGLSDNAWATPADIAEWTRVIGDPSDYEPGDIVTFASEDRRVIKADSNSQTAIVGAVSLKPGLTGVSYDISMDVTEGLGGKEYTEIEKLYNAKMIATLGYTPLKLSTEGGPIKPGDPITTSSVPGVGMKAKPGSQIVGYAYENFDPDNGKMGTNDVDLPTPIQEKPFHPVTKTVTTPSGQTVWQGWVFSYVKSSAISDLALDDTGNLKVETKGKDLTVDLTDTEVSQSRFGKLLVKGNLEVTGNVKASSIEVDSAHVLNDATVSGTLYADEIIARKVYTEDLTGRSGTFGDLLAQNVSADTVKQADLDQVNSKLAELENKVAAQPTSPPAQEPNSPTSIKDIEDLLRSVEVDEPLMAQADTWGSDPNSPIAQEPNSLPTTNVLGNLTTVGSLSVASELIINHQSLINEEYAGITTIDTLTSPLSIQALAAAPLFIMGDRIQISTNGDVVFKNNVTIEGKLAVNEINPLPGKDLSISLANNSESGFGNLLVKGVNGETVASIDASGSATLRKLVIASDGTTPSQTVTPGEISSNATAGKATLPAFTQEITIKTPYVNNNTLVYVTPISSTQNNVLYVKSKGNGQFVVGFDNLVSTDVQFNWWVIELKE